MLNSNLSDKLTGSLSGVSSFDIEWYGDAGSQRLALRAKLSSTSFILLQVTYDGTFGMYESTDGGATWSTIWTK